MAEIYNNRDKKINCPICGKFLCMADKRDCRVGRIACKPCNRLIYFIPKSGHYETKRIPERHSTSGKTIY